MECIHVSSAARIGAATLCLASCVFTLGLWLLSYRQQHQLSVALTPERALLVSSEYGRLGVVSSRVRDYRPGLSLRSYAPVPDSWLLRKETTLGFFLVAGNSYRKSSPSSPVTERSVYVELVLPDWFIAGATGGVGFALLKSWHRRFTVRMLLAATTVLAVVFALMTYNG